jgi:hypothetical protein
MGLRARFGLVLGLPETVFRVEKVSGTIFLSNSSICDSSREQERFSLWNRRLYRPNPA